MLGCLCVAYSRVLVQAEIPVETGQHSHCHGARWHLGACAICDLSGHCDWKGTWQRRVMVESSTLGTRFSAGQTYVPRTVTSHHSKARALSARLPHPCGEVSIPTASTTRRSRALSPRGPGREERSKGGTAEVAATGHGSQEVLHSLTRLTCRPLAPAAAGCHGKLGPWDTRE